MASSVGAVPRARAGMAAVKPKIRRVRIGFLFCGVSASCNQRRWQSCVASEQMFRLASSGNGFPGQFLAEESHSQAGWSFSNQAQFCDA